MAQAAVTDAGAPPRAARWRLGRDALVRRVHLLLALSFWAALMNASQLTQRGALAACVFGAGWALCLEVTALHEARKLRSRAWTAVQFGIATLAALVAAAAVTAEVSLPASHQRVLLGVVELGVLSFVWDAFVASGLGLGRPLRCLVIGAPSSARLLRREPLAPGAEDFEIVGLIDDTPSGSFGDDGPLGVPGIPLLGRLHDLGRVVQQSRVDLVVVGARTGRPAVFHQLLGLNDLQAGVMELPAFFEREFGRVPVEEINSVWFLDALGARNRGVAGAGKRLLDVVVALGLLVATAPLMLAAAIAIRLTSPGPVFYRQARVGERGRIYTVLKFRSMRVDAEADGEAVWAAEDDPRTTSIGRYLRRYRVDELPQLLNVLRGEMTMVGPRPERPEFVTDLVESVPFYEPRHMTKPGLTGWAQVSAGYAATLDDARLKLSYDLYYLKHRGLALDLAILLRTVGVVLRGTGAR
jgi:exopolysaccharide biosynthesis polyprenyl glycosylphosphotransferase